MNIGHLFLVPGDISNDKLQAQHYRFTTEAGLANTGIKGPGKLQEHIRCNYFTWEITFTGDGQDLVGREAFQFFGAE